MTLLEDILLALELGFSGAELLRLRVAGLLDKQLTDDQLARVLPATDRSNTTIVRMAGRLLSLIEGSGAHEIAPRSLTTLNPFDFGGTVEALGGGARDALRRDRHVTGRNPGGARRGRSSRQLRRGPHRALGSRERLRRRIR